MLPAQLIRISAPPEFGQDRFGQILDGSLVRDVGGEGESRAAGRRYSGRGGAEPGFAPGDEDDFCAFRRHPAGDDFTDALAGAGDDCDLVF